MRVPSLSKNNVFSTRNFRLVFFGALVSDLGAVLYSFAVSFYILEISGNNAFLQGLYLALCSAVLLLATPVGGVLGDRFNKARIMYLCDYIKGALILLTVAGMLVFSSVDAHLALLFAAGILGNAVSGIFSPAANALMPYIVEDQMLQQANAYYSAKNSLQSILGVVLAGVLYAALPVQLLLAVVGVCYLLSGLSEMFIRYQHTDKGEKMTLRLVKSDMSDGLKYLRSQKAILVLMAAILFINFFGNPLAGNFIPFFVKTDLAQAPSYLLDQVLTPELWSSVFNMLIGISMLVGSLILSAKKPTEKCGHATAIRLCAMAGLMIALTAAYSLLVAHGRSLDLFLLLFSLGSLMMGIILVGINIPVDTAIMRAVDKEQLSKVTGILNILSMGLVPISSVLAGAVLQYFGTTPLLVFCSVGSAVTALFLLCSRQVREI